MPSRSTRRRRARGRPPHHRRNLHGARDSLPRAAFAPASFTSPPLHWPPMAAAICLTMSAGLTVIGLSRALESALRGVALPSPPLPIAWNVGLMGIALTGCGAALPRQIAAWLLRQVLGSEPATAKSRGAADWSDRQIRWITFAILCLALGVALAAAPLWQRVCSDVYIRLHGSFVWSDPFLLVLVAVTVALVQAPAFLMLGMSLTGLAGLLDRRRAAWQAELTATCVIGAAIGMTAAFGFARLPAAMLPTLAALPVLGAALTCAYGVESAADAGPSASSRKGMTNDRQTTLTSDSENRAVGAARSIPYPRMGRTRPATTRRGPDTRRRLTA